MVAIHFMLTAAFFVSASTEAVDITTDEFDEFIKDRSVFVKFFSPNCPHCQRIAPVWDQVARVAPTYPQPFFVGAVDCSSETLLCDRFSIRGVPSLIFFSEGKMYKFSGKREYNDIMKFGAGDYKLSSESADIPIMGGSSVMGQTAYTIYKFMKDIIAMVRFNYWAVIFFIVLGAIVGSLVTFTIMIANLTKEIQAMRTADQAVEASQADEMEPEKPLGIKKVD